MTEIARDRLQANATSVAAMLVTGFWLALLFLPGGEGLWLPVMLFGYVVVVPVVALLYGDEADRREWWEWSAEPDSDRPSDGGDGDPLTDANRNGSTRDALETLRDRYAAGDLTDEQFEHKLDRLLEVETLEDVERARERTEYRSDREPVEREYGRDPREREYES